MLNGKLWISSKLWMKQSLNLLFTCQAEQVGRLNILNKIFCTCVFGGRKMSAGIYAQPTKEFEAKF